jgi:predicted O-methyltransferase YrrM
MSFVIHRRSPLELGLPWMSWGAIKYLESRVRPAQRVFEWGGGGSTRFFAGRGCAVTTVESSPEWRDAILGVLRAEGLVEHVKIRHVPAETRDAAAVRDYVKAIDDGGPWDVVVVDGLEEEYVTRMECLSEVRGRVVPDGLVILDDSWRPEYSDAPKLFAGWRRHVFRGLGPSRFGVTQTDIYVAPTKDRHLET